jgi:CMP/dCMP kinase
MQHSSGLRYNPLARNRSRELTKKTMIIAIDGPAGSGKSTVARAVARALGFRYLDTGAMYRAVAHRALESGLSLDDESAIARIANTEPISFDSDPDAPDAVRVRIGDEDVTRAIRTPEVDGAVSPVSSLPSVREAMVAQQRRIAEQTDAVVEGRDIGTVVFPDATLKVYLTANPEVRAARRSAQNARRGIESDESVLEALVRRDEADSSRAHSPLTCANDAVTVDTTDLSLDQVVTRVSDLVGEKRP